MTNKQLQLEIWHECNNQCSFCYLGKANLHTPNEVKLKSLEHALEIISDLSLYTEKGYNTIGYIGGEFFQGQLNTPEIRDKFFELMKKTAWLKENGYIHSVWMYVTLTIGDQKDLYNVLDLYKDLDGFWILTSYDTAGRFHTEAAEKNWRFHMKNLYNKYPKLRFNVTSILTGDLAEKYLDNKLSFKQMMEEFHCSFFLKQCGSPGMTKEQMNAKVPNFFPKRKVFLEFLKKFKHDEPAELWDKMMNIEYRADAMYRMTDEAGKELVLYHRNKETYLETCDEDYGDIATGFTLNPSCNHMDLYKVYIDSEACILCDKQMIEKIYDLENEE